MVICPQVLQAGASLCILLAAAFTASNPLNWAALKLFFTLFEDCTLPAGEELPITLTSLNSCTLLPMVGVDSSQGSLPRFSTSGLSST